MFKKIVLTLCLASASTFGAYAQFSYIEPKLNIPTLAIGLINPAVEIGFGSHSAIEISNQTAYHKDDFLGSGYPFLLNFNLLEYRYYTTKDLHTGFFAGGNFGWDMFKMSKQYVPIVAHDNAGRAYDWGMGYCLGVTLGYKYMFSNKLALELSVSGGWHLGMHEPYNQNNTATHPLNPSAEWLPYKGGLYLSYRFDK